MSRIPITPSPPLAALPLLQVVAQVSAGLFGDQLQLPDDLEVPQGDVFGFARLVLQIAKRETDLLRHDVAALAAVSHAGRIGRLRIGGRHVGAK